MAHCEQVQCNEHTNKVYIVDVQPEHYDRTHCPERKGRAVNLVVLTKLCIQDA